MRRMDAKQGRNRGLSQPPMPLERGNSFDSKGISLSHSIAQITNFMSTSFPHRSKKDDKSTPSPEVTTLKEEFERKIAAIVFCLEEKAEENIDLSYKLKSLHESSMQRDLEKDRTIDDLQKTLKAKEDECSQLEKKANNDEVLNELNRRIQTLTHCLNGILSLHFSQFKIPVNFQSHTLHIITQSYFIRVSFFISCSLSSSLLFFFSLSNN